MNLPSGLFLVLLGLLDTVLAKERKPSTDESFDERLEVHGRNVTCSGQPMGSKYTFKMMTCSDIRVDGVPLFHGNNDFKELEDDPPNDNGCPGCPCGTYDSEPNNVLALCAALLEAQGVSGRVLAAYTPSPICTQTKPEERIKFYTLDGTKTWLHTVANNGYLSRLQCRIQG